MSFEFNKIDGKPSWANSGVYTVDNDSNTNTLYLNGLDFTNDLERFSLGNWNSIVKNDKVFAAPQTGIAGLVEQGRPVKLSWYPPRIYGYYYEINAETGKREFWTANAAFKYLDLDTIDGNEIESVAVPWPDGSAIQNSQWQTQIMNVNTLIPQFAQMIFGWTSTVGPQYLNGQYRVSYSDGFGFVQEREDEGDPIAITVDSILSYKMSNIRNFEQSLAIPNASNAYMLYRFVPLDGDYQTVQQSIEDETESPITQQSFNSLSIILPTDEEEVIGQDGTYNWNSQTFVLGSDVLSEVYGAPNFKANINISNPNVPEEVNFKAICFGGISGQYSKDLEAQPGLANASDDMNSTGYSTVTSAGPYQWFTYSTYGAVLSYVEGGVALTNKVILYSNTDGVARFYIRIPNDDLVNGNTYKITGFGYTEDDIDPHVIIGAAYFAEAELILGDSPASVLGDFELHFTTDFEKFPDTHYLFFWIPETTDDVTYPQRPGAWFTLENVNITETDEFILRDPDSISAISNRALLYYDEEDDLFNLSSYPLKVNLGLDVLGDINFTNIVNDISDQTKWGVLDALYSGDIGVIEDQLDETSLLVENNVFYYEVMQWGDEDIVLSDEESLDSEYFRLYESEGSINPKDYNLKRLNQSQLVYSKTIVSDDKINLVSHIYDTPGVKSIKIIVYRYTKDLSLLIETILVTKNININDGASTSQDFEIFGGTNFNFLPIPRDRKYAFVGGLDSDSKYNISINKIAKDELYTEDDFLERKTVKHTVKKFMEGRYGKSPGKIDLSATRVFRGVQDIYDFLMTDAQKTQVVNSEFPNFSDDFFGEDNKVKIDSEATDIFINDNDDSTIKEKCILELNPQNTEYLTVPNSIGNKDKGILLGDYGIRKEKDQPLRKEGIMETPLLEEDSQKQAF